MFNKIPPTKVVDRLNGSHQEEAQGDEDPLQAPQPPGGLLGVIHALRVYPRQSFLNIF
jgi:hypothetical protein